MAKRKRSDDAQDADVQLAKRSRTSKLHLMNFTDEILLRILCFLDVGDLIHVQRYVQWSIDSWQCLITNRSSQRLQRLSNDNSIWREKYYERWVHPRVRRLPGNKTRELSSNLHYSSKLSKWPNHSNILWEDEKINWKRQYKIRANWWQGKCRIQELDVASPPAPPILVKIHKGLIITADEEHGLRIWSRNLQKEALAVRPLHTNPIHRSPTALAVDGASSHQIRVLVGFSDGSFDVLCYTRAVGIQILHSHSLASHGTTSACAISFPYILTMSEGRVVALYHLSPSETTEAADGFRCELLISLRSEVAYSPVSLSIRRNIAGLVACVAYAFCRLNLGWSLGLQELRLNQHGDLLDCRLAATADGSGERAGEATSLNEPRTTVRSAFSQSFALPPLLMSRPSSISYSHPYLTASLPDNTLIVCLVNSNAASLDINSGRRLWGHTSSISGVEVDARGKAVSISTKGNDIRVWELEDILSSNSQKRSSIRIDPVQNLRVVNDAIAKRGNGLGLAVRGIQDELAITRNWVGFDDEQVVVLGEEPSKRQILSCYDFT
jgi:hypothetical protein